MSEVITDETEIVGKFASYDLISGQFVYENSVAESQSEVLEGMEKVADGQIAYSISVKSLASSTSDKILSGDIVTVFVNVNGESVQPIELKYVKVLSASTSDGLEKTASSSESISTITFLVTEEQALLLNEYEYSASIHLALVHRGEDDVKTSLLDEQINLNTQKFQKILQKSLEMIALQTDYLKLLETIQNVVNDNYWQLNSEDSTEKSKEIILNFYRSYVTRKNIEVKGFAKDELVEKLYNDTHEYSILTKPLNDPKVEGIHINSWNCIILQMRTGEFVYIDAFESPSHAIDIMRRLIQSKGGVLDEAMPIAETSIGSDIRITTVKSPIVDENIGVSCYIRKLSKSVFRIEQYTKTGFAEQKEIEMLNTFMRRGVSLLVVGKVNTGKTTFLSYLLSTLPNNMKIVTIENSAREMDLVKKQDGKTINNVVHMLTRESKIADLDIKQEDLVVISLRLNPDYISIAEMRDSEASAAVEASRSGHPVISTTHAGSPTEAHKRIAD